MGKHEDEEVVELQVRLWLEKKGVPQRHYTNLTSPYKDQLHSRVCTQTHQSSDAQLRTLYRKLHISESRGAGSSGDAVDSMTNEELKNFFSPVPHDELPYLYKF